MTNSPQSWVSVTSSSRLGSIAGSSLDTLTKYVFIASVWWYTIDYMHSRCDLDLLTSKLNQFMFVHRCIKVVRLMKFPLRSCIHKLLVRNHGCMHTQPQNIMPPALWQRHKNTFNSRMYPQSGHKFWKLNKNTDNKHCTLRTQNQN